MTLKMLNEVNVTTENIQSKGKCVTHRPWYVVQWVNYYSNRLGEMCPKQIGHFQKSSNTSSEAESLDFSVFKGRMFWKAPSK